MAKRKEKKKKIDKVNNQHKDDGKKMEIESERETQRKRVSEYYLKGRSTSRGKTEKFT